MRTIFRPLATAALGAVAFLAHSSAAGAQDRRSVTEPVRPPTCTVLPASLTPVGDSTLADADERRLDTDRIQHALDHCAPGHAVVLHASGASRAFLTGPLALRAGVTLVVDTGTILFGSRDPRLYDVAPGRCGVVSEQHRGCRPLISATKAPHTGIMGPGTIDGRGWATLLGRDASWWQLAEQARASYRLSQNCPRLIDFKGSDDVTMYDVTLRNSPNFHVVFENGTGFTAWGVTINTPQTARNTDGIDPSASSDVTITHSWISTGDDNVAIKGGGPREATHMTISHDHFYAGHGMSVGSETNGGVSAIRVEDLTIDGADNGLRIKSNAARGGLVHDVVYRDVCIRNTKYPIFMDTHYSASAVTTGTAIPDFRDIELHSVRIAGKGKLQLQGYDAARPLRMAFDGVVADDPAALRIEASHAVLRYGPGPVNLRVAGEDVHVTNATAGAAAAPPACAGRFVPLAASRMSRVPAPRAAGSAAAASTAATPVRPAAASRYTAIVDARFTGRDGDTVAGTPMYHSIGAALTGIPANGGVRMVVFIRNGRYHEKLTVDRPRVTLLGESRDGTVLTYDAAADTPAPGGGTYGTRGSFTLRIVAPDFRAENMTIENAFDYPGNLAKADTDPTKLRNQQAVALMTDLGSDRATFVNVRVTGYQDTLFTNSGRSYFYKCEITGHVDFIFGAGQTVFDDCDIVSRDRHSATNNGYVTAPSTQLAKPYGLVFIRSRLKKEDPSMAPNSVALGRPWHPFNDPNAVGSSVFIDCWMDNHIGARGWERMAANDSTGGKVWYEPESARFFEYGTTGPGAVASPRRRVLTAAQAARYTPSLVLDGWTPSLTPEAR